MIIGVHHWLPESRQTRWCPQLIAATIVFSLSKTKAQTVRCCSRTISASTCLGSSLAPPRGGKLCVLGDSLVSLSVRRHSFSSRLYPSISRYDIHVKVALTRRSILALPRPIWVRCGYGFLPPLDKPNLGIERPLASSPEGAVAFSVKFQRYPSPPDASCEGKAHLMRPPS